MRFAPTWRIGCVTCLTIASCLAGPADAAPVIDLPPPRPPELGGRPPADAMPAVAAPVQDPPIQPADTPATESSAILPEKRVDACLARLRAAGWIVDPAPQPSPGQPECRIENPVRLTGLRDAAGLGGTVQLPDRPVVACRFAEILGSWLSGVVVPLSASRLGSPLASLQTGPGQECRTRDRIEGARISAHAIGLALDVAALTDAKGKRYLVGISPDPAEWAETFRVIRTAACGWFLTVLGPGSDAYHTDHLHLDIQQHGSSDRYRICQ